MELRTMTKAEIKTWYETELVEAFPPHEQKPLAAILDLLEHDCYDVLGLYDGHALLGYAAIVSRPELGYVLMDYLGVTAARRNRGLGAEVVRQVGERYHHRAGLLTEAECPDQSCSEAENALRLRRLGFYQRCGFVPAYEMAGCGIRLQVFLLGSAPEDLGPVMADHRALYGPLRTDIKIPIGPGETPEPPYWMK